MITEAQRQLYTELSGVLSAEGVAILMDVVGSVTIAELATKTDIAELRADMAELRAELKTDMAELRAELKTDMADLRTELKTDMAELKHDLTRAMATMLFVSQGVLVSIVGLLVAIV